jgi:hypothetical protein
MQIYPLTRQTFFMKYILLMLVATTLMSETCNNKNQVATNDQPGTTDDIPSCIHQRIDSIKKEPRWNPPAEVNEYTYNGKRVFLFSSDCCDFFNPLYDSACNYIGAPHGGITGRGDGKVPDFNEKAKHVKLVWKDPRE